MNTNEEIAQEDQTLTIPKGYFVCGCDLDKNPPTCEIASFDEESILEEKELIVPFALAYYLRTHHCGSYRMRELIEEQAKRKLRNSFKDLMNIN